MPPPQPPTDALAILPDTVLIKIIALVDHKTRQCSIPLVSTRFARLYAAPSEIHSELHIDASCVSTMIMEIRNHLEHLGRLPSHALEHGLTEWLTIRGPSVRKLQLLEWDTETVVSRAISESETVVCARVDMLQHMPALTHITLVNFTLDPRVIATLATTTGRSLQKLAICYKDDWNGYKRLRLAPPVLTADDLAPLGEHCASLQVLDLDGLALRKQCLLDRWPSWVATGVCAESLRVLSVRGIKDDVMLPEALGRCTALQELTLQRRNDPTGVQVLTTLSHLSSLTLERCSVSPDIITDVLPHMTGLTRLTLERLRWRDGLQGESMMFYEDNHAHLSEDGLAALTNLQALTIAHCGVHWFPKFITALTALTTLHLTPGTEMVYVDPGLTALQSLRTCCIQGESPDINLMLPTNIWRMQRLEKLWGASSVYMSIGSLMLHCVLDPDSPGMERYKQHKVSIEGTLEELHHDVGELPSAVAWLHRVVGE